MSLDTATPDAAVYVPVGTLEAAAAFLSRIVERRCAIPILTHVKFCQSGAIVASDLDIEARYLVPALVGCRPFTLPLDTLKAAVKGAGRGTLARLEYRAGTKSEDPHVATEIDGLRSCMDTLPVEDFPTIPHRPAPGAFPTTSDVLRSALGFLEPNISTEATRYYLNGVYICPEHGGRVVGVATDGHRLGHVVLSEDAPEVFADPTFKGTGVIVPTKSVKILLASLPKGAQPVTLAIGPGQINISAPDWTLRTRVIDGTFPDYSRLMPTVSESVTLDRLETLARLKRIAGVQDERKAAIAVDAATRQLRAAKHAMDLPVLGSSVQRCAGYNATYLREALESLPGRSAVLGFPSEDGSPGLLTSADAPDRKIVLMPMHI